MERALVISSKLGNINKVRLFLKELYQEGCLNMDSFNRVFLGISEAVANAIKHGNQLNPEKKIFIRASLSENCLHIEVEDQGEGFCPVSLADPTAAENIRYEHGRGIYILRQLADQLVFKEDGRKIFIQFTLSE